MPPTRRGLAQGVAFVPLRKYWAQPPGSVAKEELAKWLALLDS